MKVKISLAICFLLLASSVSFSESFEKATISTEVSPEELKKLYGKNTKFSVDEISYRHLNTIKLAYHTTIYKDNRKTRTERKSSYQDMKTLLDSEDNRFYGVLIRSFIQFSDDELSFSVSLIENDQALPGEEYFFPIKNGNEYWYYFIYKLDKPYEGKELKLLFTYPDQRKQLLRIES